MAWIAAKFERDLPNEFRLGDNGKYGGYHNRQLKEEQVYKVFVRAYTANSVSSVS